MRFIQTLAGWKDQYNKLDWMPVVRRIAPPLPGLILATAVLLLSLMGGVSRSMGIVPVLLMAGLAASILLCVLKPIRSNKRLDSVLYQVSTFVPGLAFIWVLLAALPVYSELIFPIALLGLAWVAATMPTSMLIVASSYAILADVCLFFGRGGWAVDLTTLAFHCIFIGLFSLGGALLLRVEVRSTRTRIRTSTRQNMQRLQAEAKALGLPVQPGTPNVDPRLHLSERIASLHRAFEEQLQQTRHNTSAFSAVLMLRTSPGGFHVCRAITPANEFLNQEQVSLKTGLLSVLADQTTDSGPNRVLRIFPLEGHMAESLPYYREVPTDIRSLLAIGIRQEGELVGALWLDRMDDQPFSEREVQCAEMAIDQIKRILETERDLLLMGRRTGVLEQFMSATQSLTQAFEPEEVHEAILCAATRFAPLRFGALVVTDPRTGKAQIVHTIGEGAKGGPQSHVDLNGSLAMSAIRANAPCPVSHRWADGHGSLCGAGVGPKIKSGAPVIALPLMVRDKTIGSLVLAPEHPLDDDTIQVLVLLTSQAAMVVQHAQSLADLSARATTDSLTGLDNRATLHQKMGQAMARADRNHQPATLLMLDIDHFKQINDTHGHQIGDRVLQKVASVLEHSKRLNDAVGRYGGEEFAVVLENTGAAGGQLVAERIRKHISELQFRGTTGTFRVTVSIGFAVYPTTASSGDELVQRADKGLYQAKQAGRNQVCGFTGTATNTISVTPAHA